MADAGKSDKTTVKLAEHRLFSPSFHTLYDEGMGLVEETASYLDGDGRAEAKMLERKAATLYAAESMRLTTRLMQIASWLLLQRAANSGEMTRAQVTAEKTKVRLDTLSARETVAEWPLLPDRFRELVRRSLSLQTRVRRMDEEIYGAAEGSAAKGPVTANPVSEQLTLLKTAFGSR